MRAKDIDLFWLICIAAVSIDSFSGLYDVVFVEKDKIKIEKKKDEPKPDEDEIKSTW